MELEAWVYLLLFLAALVAGLVDAIAGGGGLIALPALLTAGFPVPLALGTNKLQAFFGSAAAAAHYAKSGVIDWRSCRQGVVWTLIGALIGAWTVQRIDASRLGVMIPWLLAAILVYTIFKPELGREKRRPRLAPNLFWGVAGLGLGVLGQDFLAATGQTKVMNAASNLTAVLVFAAGGQIHWLAGGVMAVGQLLGARVGAGWVVKKGTRFIRPVFLTIVTLTIGRLAYIELTRPR